MSNNNCTCEIIPNIDFKLDEMSKKVAEKLSGISLKEKVSQDSKLFADHKISKWFFNK